MRSELAICPEDLRACGDILRRGSKSFALASALLPRRVRAPTTVLYAFCREADDRIDEHPEHATDALGALHERLARAYAGRPLNGPVDRALAATVEATSMPRALLDALLEGFAWDAAARRYETLDDLNGYAARVAGTVGAMMTLLMGRRAEPVVARACELGIAMQLTNIARDVGEDAARGRVYLPLAWMREAGIEPEELVRGLAPREPLAALVARLLAVASELYAGADEGIGALPGDCRVAIRAARLIYADIGRVIAVERFDTVSRRAFVPAGRKMWLLLRAAGARFWRAPEGGLPPLPSARFLVSACLGEGKQ